MALINKAFLDSMCITFMLETKKVICLTEEKAINTFKSLEKTHINPEIIEK